MSSKTLLWMALGAAALGGLAYYLDGSRAAATARGAEVELVPGLTAKLNDVDRLSAQVGEDELVFEREGDTWRAASHGGYPADRTKVGTYLLALEGAKRLERKTSRPERYADLGLDPEAEGAPTARVIAQAGETPVADLYVGSRRSTGAGTAYYVRLEGEPTAYVAEGDLRFSSRLADWLDTNVLDVARERVVAARVTHPDGDVTVVSKAKDAPEDERMAIQNLPPGTEPQSEWVTSRFESALARLTFEGVEAAADADFDEAAATKAEFWTRHGLKVTVESVELPEGEGLSARIRAEYDPTGAPLPYEGPVVEEPLELELETEGGAEEGEAEEDAPPTPEELEAEAAELNAATEGWLYRLPQYKAQALRPRSDELVKPIEGNPLTESTVEELGLPDEVNSILEDVINAPPGDLPPIPPPPPTEDPPTQDPPAEDPPAQDPPAADPPAGDPPADPPTGGGEEGSR